jgi:hypothetical protein
MARDKGLQRFAVGFCNRQKLGDEIHSVQKITTGKSALKIGQTIPAILTP